MRARFLSRCSNTTKYQTPESKYKYKIYEFILLKKRITLYWAFFHLCMCVWADAFDEEFMCILKIFLFQKYLLSVLFNFYIKYA